MNNLFRPIASTLLLACLTCPTYLLAQLECGTDEPDSLTYNNRPWVGNNQFLTDLTDSLNNITPPVIPKSLEDGIEGGFDEEVIFWVPVKAWVYNNDAGGGGIPEHEVEESIRILNENFAGRRTRFGATGEYTRIQYYLGCDISYRNNSEYAINPSDGILNNKINAMFNENFTAGVMNIHFIQSHNEHSGKARWPGGAKSFTCMITTNLGYHLSGALAHEVGHALDLLHTHQGRPWGNNGDKSNCFQEAVSRAKIQPVACGNFSGAKKCERNGDRLCDTEADPGLQEIHVTLDPIAGTAIYNNGGQDNWGEPWAPDVRNVMSYAPPGALETFTEQQASVMAWWVSADIMPFPGTIDIGLNYIPLNNDNPHVDIYEPDNQMENAKTIEFGTTQHRGLHRSYSQNRYSPTIETCDMDWIYFELAGSASKKINIFTEGVLGKPEPDTEIFLYESDGTTLIASNDDASSSNSFSELSEIVLSPGSYYIAVRGNGNTFGEYYISAEYCQESCCFQPLLEGISELLVSVRPTHSL